MRHRKKGKKFGRERKQRKALLYGLASSVVLKGKIQTTLARAKALVEYLEPLITRARRGGNASRIILSSKLSKKAREKLLSELVPRLKDRQGGTMRIIKSGRRRKDAAPLAFIEFVT